MIHREHYGLRANPAKHGPLVEFDMQGTRLSAEMWRHGVRQGPWRRWQSNRLSTGAYLAGEPHGLWVKYTTQGDKAEEEEYHQGERRRRPYFNAGVFRTSDLPPTVMREELHYRGGKIAEAVLSHPKGEKQSRTRFRGGQPHGFAQGWHSNGARSYEGQWDQGRPVGRWTLYHDDGAIAQTIDLGERPDDQSKAPLEAAIEDRWAKSDSPWDDKRWRLPNNFWSRADVRSLEGLGRFCVSHGLDVILHRAALRQAGIDPTRELPPHLLEAPVAVIIPAVFEERGLIAVRRFGAVVVTAPAEAGDWTDRTGVAGILANPASPLAAKLSKPTRADFLDEPLKGILDFHQDYHQITFAADWPALERLGLTSSVTMSMPGESLGNVFAMLLDLHGLCCRERDGHLVIEPLPDGVARGLKESVPAPPVHPQR